MEEDHSSKFELKEGGGFGGKNMQQFLFNIIELSWASIYDCVHFSVAF